MKQRVEDKDAQWITESRQSFSSSGRPGVDVPGAGMVTPTLNACSKLTRWHQQIDIVRADKILLRDIIQDPPVKWWPHMRKLHEPPESALN